MTFKDQLNEDFSAVILNPGEFGQVIIHTPAVGAPYTLNAIYDTPHQAIETDAGVPIIDRNLIVTVNENDLQSPPGPGDTITVGGTVFKVIDFQPDGTGEAEIYLHNTL